MISKANLIEILQKHSSVEVKFKKKSTGEDRVMLCTLNQDILAADGALKKQEMPKTLAEMIANGYQAIPKKERFTPEHIVHVYDIEASHWKSFDINTVYEVNYE